MTPNPVGPAGSGNAPAIKDNGGPSYAEAATPNTPGYFPKQDAPGASSTAPAKKKKHRGGKKRRNRRQSFAATPDLGTGDMSDERPSMGDSRGSSGFYRHHGNLSSTSLESEALLDHRDHPTIRTRRPSVPVTSAFQPRASQPFVNSPARLSAPSGGYGRSRLAHTPEVSYDDQYEDDADDRTPLMGNPQREARGSAGYGGASTTSSVGRQRRLSRTSASSEELHRPNLFTQHHHSQTNLDEYDVNNPPSVPTSPAFDAVKGLDDVMFTGDLNHSPELGRPPTKSRDALIDIDEPSPGTNIGSPTTPGGGFRRRMTASAIGDVCFPHEAMSELGNDDEVALTTGEPTTRRRRRQWPNLEILDAWSRQEKEQRTVEGMRMRKVSEPLMVNGRLRPKRQVWHREMSDAPFRFTYFNENFDNTIHSQNISELVQPGQTFRTLFIPDAPVLEDSSDDDSDDEDAMHYSTNGNSRAPTRSASKLGDKISSGEQTRSTTPRPTDDKSKRFGPRPAWWLDVLSPTENEMTVIQKTFGLHPLTTEDILMQEQREKVELFKHYYFINYRTFEQDEHSEDYLEPVNLYVVVFREGVISFHFSMTPHPANVRRRVRQLSDYLVLSPDWISYAIIDDITDAYQPMIQGIEEEVDEIDEAILRLHSIDGEDAENEDEKVEDQSKKGRDMLRRVGECRKKVMSLYRLLGNKADVIKGFAKRCNEQWDIAPRNEIGMYLGDIQDHIVTMTANLSHYENLLSRAHSNYLAQINIRMNERQEKTSDILGKLTVLGTIVLPMNVVTGIWGMNCLVPGQDVNSLTWFWCITGGLIGFGTLCYLIAKRVYGIV
ncbi:cora-domain-containing protein [Dothidotthia symphoricarpi CBS 119687]|uniref:Cora-domain-containing protein n=1 Tax=Dothidotthia symphoricarpi CBS 119687 TaxID=1392245 RepID=A0A6A6AVH1_9PLEO|nr:cora-domain-containing protein [Dothidotthia symphoricarpi CBS 119687]KAF2134531.1 cora-domain-containing protein [Dothidotthia symphoricarpi CBS 119687]